MSFCSVVIMDINKDSASVAKSYFEDYGYSDIHLFSEYAEGIEYIKSLKEAPIVMLDITNVDEETCGVINTIRLHTPKIIVTSMDYSTDIIIKAFRVGAKDFLPKPIIKKDLTRILEIFGSEELQNSSASEVITVFSNKGGIGKTTIAINLAKELAQVTGDKVALVDLNLQLGDIATFLDLNPTFNVSYVVKNLLDKKEENLLSVFEKYKDTNLYILADPAYIEQSVNISPQGIESLISSLRNIFSYIVLDMTSNIDSTSLTILDNSDRILFTSIINIPAIRNCQRCLTLFNSRRYQSGKVKIVLNRYMESDEIKLDDIESTLNEKIYWKLPNNYFSIMEAINKGVTVSEVNPNSNIAIGFKDLAVKLSDDIIEESILKYRK